MTFSVPPRIAYVTAGGAGMYCGSCLRDNTLAGSLLKLGVDVQLIPTYTPIRTDEEDFSIDRVFLGGINVFLQQKLPLFRRLPSLVGRLLDRPSLIRWASSRGIRTDAGQLGALTVSMLKGSGGYQRKEIQKMVAWIANSFRPQLVNLTNILIAGCVPDLKAAMHVPILVTLQGDDIFLEALPEPYKSEAVAQIRQLAAQIDGFIVFSRFYADFMADYFQLPLAKIHIVPLGIRVTDFSAQPRLQENSTRRTIGYLARICPDKGLHLLVDAFLKLRQIPGNDQVRLHIGGWLSETDRDYAEKEFSRIRAAGLESAFEYRGVLDRQEKVRFLQEIDVLSVPTTYREPKGIYVLEALASGVPVVQPEHGAFPELLERTGGGRLVRPNDANHLAETLQELLTDEKARKQLGRTGRETVHRELNAESMAQTTLAVYQQYLEGAN